MVEEIVREARGRVYLNEMTTENFCSVLECHVLFNEIMEGKYVNNEISQGGEITKIRSITYRKYSGNDWSLPDHNLSFEEFQRLGRPKALEVKVEVNYSSLDNQAPQKTQVRENDCIQLRFVGEANKINGWRAEL